MKLPDAKNGGDGHYITFREQCLDSKQNFGDTHQPIVLTKNLGKCDFCSSFYFSAITEKKRHMSLFHLRNKVKVHSNFNFICNYQDCNKRFGSLSRHKKRESHSKRQN